MCRVCLRVVPCGRLLRAFRVEPSPPLAFLIDLVSEVGKAEFVKERFRVNMVWKRVRITVYEFVRWIRVKMGINKMQIQVTQTGKWLWEFAYFTINNRGGI